MRSQRPVGAAGLCLSAVMMTKRVTVVVLNRSHTCTPYRDKGYDAAEFIEALRDRRSRHGAEQVKPQVSGA